MKENARLRNRVVVLAVVVNKGCALQYVSPEMRADRGVVLVSLACDGYALKYASVELQVDQDMEVAGVARSSLAFQYATPELQADRDFVLSFRTFRTLCRRWSCFFEMIPLQCYDARHVVRIYLLGLTIRTIGRCDGKQTGIVGLCGNMRRLPCWWLAIVRGL